MTRDFKTIFENLWDISEVGLPFMCKEYFRSYRTIGKGITYEELRKEEDYMGVFERTHYTPDSYDAVLCRVVAPTLSECNGIINHIRKICAEFQPTTTEKLLGWEGGDWSMFQPFRYEFEFVVMIRKSGIAF
jgi:hypothetical protein